MYNLTLLYAEDDTESRTNYAFVLEEYFSKVYVARDGREALELYYDKKPDVLLLDISMPFVNGLDVAKTVRKTNKDVPIIMLTAHADQQKLLTAIPLGLSKYLLKPIDDKSLIQTVLKAIREIQAREIVPLGKNLEWNKTTSNLLYKDESVKLTKKEKGLMEFLCGSTGKYFMHDALILHVWDNEIPNASHDNKLHQLVYRLNKKINGVTNSDVQLIENSYTLGYRIDCYS